MPIPILEQTISKGISSIPYAYPILKSIGYLTGTWALKRYFGGAVNPSERVMHSKVVMVTGGTSGIGAAVVQDLAARGAQIILLTQHSPSDPFLVDFIEDLRSSTGNQLIYAEQVDLSSFYSIRLFATKWIDNTPARRLDMVILCANTQNPYFTSSTTRKTQDGLQNEWQINYLSNYHLLSILSPALRAQPPDRDVRVIFTTCSSYIGAEKLDFKHLEATTTITQSQPDSSTRDEKPSKNLGKKQPPPDLLIKTTSYASSKLALLVFARSFQQHLTHTPRTDKQNNPLPPPSVRVMVVDPGFSRTPGTRNWLTAGSLWGLIIYILTWPIWWLVLKSPQQGAQSILMAAMEARFSNVGHTLDPDTAKNSAQRANLQNPLQPGQVIGIEGGAILKECKERPVLRPEIMDDVVAKKLWEFSQSQIERKEKEAAIIRAMEKKAKEELKKENQEKSGITGWKTQPAEKRK
ncbi:hypothetical protein FQN57_007471 [Myotisia sp. PD_48]|nr:hypothetical protein FQN57_007471 [Myotisia sp. PD_48]